MKKIIRALAVLGVFGAAVLFGEYEKRQALERIHDQAYSDVNFVDEDLAPYLEDFFFDAYDKGIDLSHVYSGDITVIFVDERYGRTLGIAWEMYNDDMIVITIPRKEWGEMNEAKRKAIMYHEFGHDILNLEHGTTPLMNASAGEYTMSKTDRQIDQMFEYYKNK